MEEEITLEEGLRLARAMKAPTPRIGKIPTTKAIDRYIRLEGKLEQTRTGSAEESRILYQLSKLEAVGKVTTDDVMQRRKELREEG